MTQETISMISVEARRSGTKRPSTDDETTSAPSLAAISEQVCRLATKQGISAHALLIAVAELAETLQTCPTLGEQWAYRFDLCLEDLHDVLRHLEED